MNFTPEADQIDMRDHLLSPGKRKTLFCGMGRGKTAATLEAIADTICNTAGGALVIAPLNVCLLTWPGEITYWNQFRWMRIANLRTKEGLLHWYAGTADIYLINWDSLPSFIKKVLAYIRKTDKLPVNIVVYDELSKAKSHSSKRVNMWRRFTYLFDYHWGLTGTPNPNSYQDLFAQFRLICGSSSPLGTAFGKFQQEYFSPADWQQYKWELRPGSKDKIEELIKPYVLSLGAGEFPIDYIDREVTMNKAAREAYDELEEELLVDIEGKEVTAANAAVLVQKLLQVTSGCVYNEHREMVKVHDAKIQELRKIRKEFPKEPLLVVTLFKHERHRVMKAFPDAELFDQKDLGRWNAGEIPIWIIDPRSAGHGLNLQGPCHIAIWMTQTYSREQWDQTNARLARKGQKHTVKVFRLMCPGTVDWAVADVLERKGSQQKGLLNALSNIKKLHNK